MSFSLPQQFDTTGLGTTDEKLNALIEAMTINMTAIESQFNGVLDPAALRLPSPASGGAVTIDFLDNPDGSGGLVRAVKDDGTGKVIAQF